MALRKGIYHSVGAPIQPSFTVQAPDYEAFLLSDLEI